MGCDIHIITEIRKNDTWERVYEIPNSLDDRNYLTFSILADVRNSFDTKHFDVKGIPDDISALRFGFNSFTEKVRNEYDGLDKFVLANGGWSNKCIPQLLGVCWHEFLIDNIIIAIKKYKNPTINFKSLFNLLVTKIKNIQT